MRTENLQSQQRIQGFTPTATLPVILFSNIPQTGQNWKYKFFSCNAQVWAITERRKDR
jgi:hypothetical protein